MAVAYAVLLVALVLTLLAYHYVRQDVEDAARYRFSETVLAARGAIENQMGSYVDAMFGARALFYASDSVEMEEWSGYANGINLTERYEGMRVLGYAKRVEPEGRVRRGAVPNIRRDEPAGARAAAGGREIRLLPHDLRRAVR
jgi:CHASE1-domain containing sensor protein